MKKKIIILILLTVLTTLYFYLYSVFTYDSVWNYGFAYNIVHGLVPYKDYNMIITPLFPYLLSILILFFGHKLILYYIFISILIVLTSYICYKKIGYKSIAVFFLLLAIHELGYNVLALFLFMSLLYLLDNDDANDLLIAIIIGLMILTKQTLGLLIIPSIIYSKNKKKTIITYIIVFLIFLCYLIINNSLLQFVDYCFFGMFDFTSNNGTKFTLVTLGEIIICFSLVLALIKSKLKNKELFYILLFQIIVFPIVDGVHFIITFIPILYYIFYRLNYKYINYLIYMTILSFTVVYNLLQIDYSLDTLNSNKNSFMYKRRIQNYLNDYFIYIRESQKKYKESRIYFLDSRAYLVKLELNTKINKYDLINYGNMGYHGDERYIREIDNYCDKHSCVFFISGDKEIKQMNKRIIDYVKKNYNQEASSSLENIYKN
ncbi:MAG: hypothetical protein IKF19_04095 [Bacilli bacterium]|nr:hypothetical protein [Bacilli bacterium]